MHGEIQTLGIKAGDSQQQHSPKKENGGNRLVGTRSASD
jgi:hypothetical protein